MAATKPKTQDNPLAEVFDTSMITDGSGVAPGATETIVDAVAHIRSNLQTAFQAGQTLTKMNKSLGYYTAKVLFSVLNAAGYPVISMEGEKAPQAAKLLIDALYDEAYAIPENADDDAKREIRKLRAASLTSVRLFRKRVMNPALAVKHVIANGKFTAEQKAQMLEPGFLKWGDPDPDFPEIIMLKQVPKFIADQVAEIYRRSGLDVPTEFGGEAPDGNEQGTKDKKVSPDAADKVYGEQVATFTPLRASESIEKLVKHYSHQVLALDGVTDRDQVAVNLHTVSSITSLLAKYCDGKITDAERTTLDSLIELPEVLQQLREELQKAS